MRSGLLDWGLGVSFDFPGFDPEDCEVDPEVETGLGVLEEVVEVLDEEGFA